MFVEILKTDDHTGVKSGEVYEAERYWLDPQCKVTLLSRIPDGHNPSANEYFENVRIMEGVIVCPRCLQDMNDKEEAEGCEDYQCPMKTT